VKNKTIIRPEEIPAYGNLVGKLHAVAYKKDNMFCLTCCNGLKSNQAQQQNKEDRRTIFFHNF
jgi:hypothetical protein